MEFTIWLLVVIFIFSTCDLGKSDDTDKNVKVSKLKVTGKLILLALLNIISYGQRARGHFCIGLF